MADRALDVWNYGAQLPIVVVGSQIVLYGVRREPAFLRVCENGAFQKPKMGTRMIGKFDWFGMRQANLE